MSGSRSSQAGFSLLEILIAVAILAGLMAVLGPTLSIAARTASRIHQDAQYEENARAAGRFLNDVISQTVWLDKNSADAPVTGDARRVEIRTLDGDVKTPVMVDLAIEPGAPQTLTARFSGSGAIENERYVILSNISNARFQYMTRDANRTQWRDRWRESSAPALIRLTGTLRYGDEERAFSFEVSPGSRAPLHCAFDPISRQCR